MDVHDGPLAGLKIVKLKVHGDERGFFVERFNRRGFRQHDLPTEFVQDNHSRSAPGVLRGLHYQSDPGQGKLIGVTRGRIWDVVVDIRKNSLTYGQYFALELSDLNATMLWVPGGFAHGFCVLGDQGADVLYKVDQFYDTEKEGGIIWNDPDIGIPWPINSPVISNRDRDLPPLAALANSFSS